jgi:hypothetical protein
VVTSSKNVSEISSKREIWIDGVGASGGSADTLASLECSKPFMQNYFPTRLRIRKRSSYWGTLGRTFSKPCMPMG